MTCKPMRKLSLFSGIGGLDLAAKLAGMETVAFCEREAYPCRVLMNRFPGTPIYDDVRTLTVDKLKEDGIIAENQPIDLISAGYPCQPFSAAGKRRGEKDDRHLWPEVARLLYEIRPTWFIGENVAGHVSLGLDTVLSDLAAIGYEAEPFIVPACAVGATNRRDRVFIVAYTDIPAEWSLDAGKPRTPLLGDGKPKLEQLFTEQFGNHIGWSRVVDEYCNTSDVGYAAEPGLPDRGQAGFLPAAAQADARVEQQFERPGQDVADATGFPSHSENLYPDQRTWAQSKPGWTNAWTGFANDSTTADAEIRTAVEGGFASAEPGMGRILDGFSAWLDHYPWPAGMGSAQHDWEPPRTAVNVPDRVARLKALGNAVNPIQAFPFFYVIRQIHDYMHPDRLAARSSQPPLIQEGA